MNTLKSSTGNKPLPLEPYRFTKRLGSTVYEVNVYLNQDAKETMNDKKLRLIRREMEEAS